MLENRALKKTGMLLIQLLILNGLYFIEMSLHAGYNLHLFLAFLVPLVIAIGIHLFFYFKFPVELGSIPLALFGMLGLFFPLMADSPWTYISEYSTPVLSVEKVAEVPERSFFKFKDGKPAWQYKYETPLKTKQYDHDTKTYLQATRYFRVVPLVGADWNKRKPVAVWLVEDSGIAGDFTFKPGEWRFKAYRLKYDESEKYKKQAAAMAAGQFGLSIDANAFFLRPAASIFSGVFWHFLFSGVYLLVVNGILIIAAFLRHDEGEKGK